MKYELKSIGYWSAIKISFVLNLIIGFIVGVFYALFMGIILSLATQFPMFSEFSGAYGEEPSIGALIIILPIMFSFMAAVFNTIFVIIAVFIYNMSAKLIGGLEMEFTEIRIQPVAVSPASQPAAQPVRPEPAPPPPPPPVEPLPPDMTPPDEQTDDSKE